MGLAPIGALEELFDRNKANSKTITQQPSVNPYVGTVYIYVYGLSYLVLYAGSKSHAPEAPLGLQYNMVGIILGRQWTVIHYTHVGPQTTHYLQSTQPILVY